MKLIIALITLTTCLSAEATTKAVVPADLAGTVVSPVTCEVHVEFNRPTHKNQHISFRGVEYDEALVSWMLDISSATQIKAPAAGMSACPDDARFEMAVRGAWFFDNNGTELYVYPVHVSQPSLKQRMTVHVYQLLVTDPRTTKTRTEWLAADWDTDVTFE